MKLLTGDALTMLKTLPDESVRCCVTSPPYWGLRDYGTAIWTGGDATCDHKPRIQPRGERRKGKLVGSTETVDAGTVQRHCHCGAVRVDKQIGLEPSPEEFIAKLVAVFAEVRRVLTKDGTLWVNIGDSYASDGGMRRNNNGSGSHSSLGWPGQDPATLNKVQGMNLPRLQSGAKAKDLVGIPWMLAFALRADGWYLRQDIIWAKPNPMPESVTDRCTKSHEYVFLLSKSRRYFFDHEAIQEPIAQGTIDRLDQDVDGQQGSTRANGGTRPDRPMKALHQKGVAGWATGPGSHSSLDHNRERGEDEKFKDSHAAKVRKSGNLARKPGSARGCPEGTGSNVSGSVPWEGATRNKRSVWTIATVPFSEAHFATFPPELAENCIRAGTAPGDTVLDPFAGACTTLLVADRLGRNAIGIELNPQYADMGDRRIYQDAPLFHNITREEHTDGE